MKCVISSTYDDKYLYFLPITVWCWNKIGVDVICFMPRFGYEKEDKSDGKWLNKSSLVHTTMRKFGMKWSCHYFDAPKHKEATYAQCLRNFGAAIQGLDEDELLCSSDVDMICFKKPPYNDMLTIWGSDLVPKGQMPMCYINGTVKQWKEAFNIGDRTYQQCIDDLLGEDECEHYRGNRWSVDQEQSFLNISKVNHNLIPRAKEGTQWATRRYDRDDSYILDRLNPDTIDYHLNRPGYEEKNFAIIMEVLKYHFPQEDFTWLRTYTEQYKKIL